MSATKEALFEQQQLDNEELDFKYQEERYEKQAEQKDNWGTLWEQRRRDIAQRVGMIQMEVNEYGEREFMGTHKQWQEFDDAMDNACYHCNGTGEHGDDMCDCKIDNSCGHDDVAQTETI